MPIRTLPAFTIWAPIHSLLNRSSSMRWSTPCALSASTGSKPSSSLRANNHSMIHTGLVKVLLVEDDEDDYIIARDLFSEMSGQRFVLNWVKTFETGLETMCRNQHDVVLVDYRLGAQNGVEL